MDNVWAPSSFARWYLPWALASSGLRRLRMIDPTGVVVKEVRDAAAVIAIVGAKVRGDEPAAGWAPPFITVTWLTNDRSPFGINSGRLGLLGAFLSVKCYGTTPAQAIQLYGAMSDAIHMKKVRIDGGRLLFRTVDEGANADEDPVTKWPLVDATVVVTAQASAVV